MKLENKLKGGKGDYLKSKDVDKQQLRMGIKVEMEHTDDEDIAREIALDHLHEDPEYYTKLKSCGLADELEEAAKVEKQDKVQTFESGFDQTEQEIFKTILCDAEMDGFVKINVPIINTYRVEVDYALKSDDKKRLSVYCYKNYNPAYDYSISLSFGNFDIETHYVDQVSSVVLNLTKDEITEPGKLGKEILKHSKIVPNWFDFKDFLVIALDNENKEDGE